jgi:hypothetical protein
MMCVAWERIADPDLNSFLSLSTMSDGKKTAVSVGRTRIGQLEIRQVGDLGHTHPTSDKLQVQQNRR